MVLVSLLSLISAANKEFLLAKMNVFGSNLAIKAGYSSKCKSANKYLITPCICMQSVTPGDVRSDTSAV